MQKLSTSQLLAQSLKELSLEIPIDKITIKDITDRTGVIRPTFYNHFQDKYDLLEWIIQTELIDPVIPVMQGGFIHEGLTLIFSRMEKEKDFYINAAHLEGQNSFAMIVEDLIREMFLGYINTKTTPNMFFRRWMSADLIAEYYAQCVRFIIIKWTLTGMTLPATELSFLCEAVLENSLDEIISQMK